MVTHIKRNECRLLCSGISISKKERRRNLFRFNLVTTLQSKIVPNHALNMNGSPCMRVELHSVSSGLQSSIFSRNDPFHRRLSYYPTNQSQHWENNIHVLFTNILFESMDILNGDRVPKKLKFELNE